MTPVARSTARTRWLPTSQISSRPSGSIATLCGWRSCARDAGPPSPENPGEPVPASVEMTPVPRVDLADDVVVALGDVEMPGAVERDLVRHVQRRVVAGPPSPA